MTILFSYVCRQILRLFSTVLLVVIFIYLAVDFFEKIDDFMEASLPLATAARFFFV